MDMQELLDVKALAKLLGLTEMSIYRLVKRGELPYVRLGRRVIRFEQEKIEDWIKAHARVTEPR